MPMFRPEAVCERMPSDAAAFFRVRTEESLPSTNAALKEQARLGEEAGAVLIAGEQSAGVGRLGRSFFSPSGTGLYLSVLLRPALSPEEVRFLTPCAAVAAAESIEAVCPCCDARVKWVNDIYLREKKVCGILTEASFAQENGALSLAWAVIGFGVDLCPPADGFPDALSHVAGTVFDAAPEADLRPVLAAALLSRLYAFLSSFSEHTFVPEYRRRSLLDGRRVLVRRESVLAKEEIPATALGITEDCGLSVRFDDGHTEVLSSGEVAQSCHSVHLL